MKPEQTTSMSAHFIDEVVELHAKGDRRPVLLEVIDRFAWSLFHDPLEAPPGVQMTSLEHDLFMLRAYEPFTGMSDVELLTMHQTEPMLLAVVTSEVALHEVFRWCTAPPPAKQAEERTPVQRQDNHSKRQGG
jgi:hypothetical protein